MYEVHIASVPPSHPSAPFSLFTSSYDLRGPTGPKAWSDAHVLGDRADFSFGDYVEGGDSSLTVNQLDPSDAGLYRCRVDFRAAPTRNSMANLTVVGELLRGDLLLLLLSPSRYLPPDCILRREEFRLILQKFALNFTLTDGSKGLEGGEGGGGGPGGAASAARRPRKPRAISI